MTPFEENCLSIAKKTLLATVVGVLLAAFSLILSLSDKHPNHLEISITSTLSSTLMLIVSEQYIINQ